MASVGNSTKDAHFKSKDYPLLGRLIVSLGKKGVTPTNKYKTTF